MLPRVVSKEVLDDLPAADPRAMRSRRDLRRVHLAMGTRTILLHALRDMPDLRRSGKRLRILELGAGDGSLMLGIAHALGSDWGPVDLTLLDAQHLISQETIDRFAKVDWSAVACVTDVFEWADSKAHDQWDLVVTNLFLHHFEGTQLTRLVGAIAARTGRFLACEPRRGWLPLAGSHLIGALGANALTREDAVLSVHAGFRARELTALWPGVGTQWNVQEYAAGLFIHCFRAEAVRVV